MRTFVKGTRRFSEGRRALSRAIGIRQIRRNPENSSYVPECTDVLLNWGQSGEDYGNVPRWINHPDAVRTATSKMRTYDKLRESGVPTCVYTTDHLKAAEWYNEGTPILHRALDRGSQGRGISRGYSVEAGFHVKEFGNEDNTEYRIHVVDGEVIDRTQKRRRSRRNGYTGEFDSTIRSSGNGWVFCREGLACPRVLDEAARDAVEALGLDFGAVDCAISTDGEVCVYEVNTAPGLEGTTLERYSRAIRDAITLRATA